MRTALLLVLLTAPLAGAQTVRVEIDAGAALAAAPAGSTVGVRGDTPPLAWDRSLALVPDGGVHAADLAFADGTGRVAYKVVLEPPGGEPVWEDGANRLLLPGRMDADRRAFGAPQTELPVRTVSQRELGQDLALLQRAMEALHPGLMLHNTEADLGRVLDRLGADVRRLAAAYGEAIPMPAAYLPIARAVAALRDGHTQVSLYNQSDELAAALYARPDRVPFAFRLVGGRMVVTGDATPDRALPRGTEVLTLDGRPVADVLDALVPYASADGGNDAKRLDQLEVSAAPAPAERFDVVYSLLFEPQGPLALTVRDADGAERAVSAERVTAAARRDTLLARDPSLPRTPDDLLSYRLDTDGTAVLAVGSFATFNMDRDYDAWLTEAFQDMNARGAERLVVDLRDVAGGMDAAALLLFRHLLNAPAQITLWRGSTVYDVVPESLRPHLRSWTADFYDLTGQVTAAGDGTFRLPARPALTVTPAPDAFAGPTAVLVDATASSATFYLAQQVQEAGAATLVGQETGGSLRGLNAGQMAFLRLPHTGITVDIPLFASRPPTPGPDRGVTPDVVVAPNADAVIAGRDLEMEAARAHLDAR